MSCHGIGHGLNSVVKEIVKLYKTNQISFEATKKLILACHEGLVWCDGDLSEVFECMSYCRCGNCLKLVPKGEPIYSVFEVSNDVYRKYDVMDTYHLVSDGLCETCFTEVINDYCNDENAAQREIAYIRSNYDEEEYTSTGEDG